MRYTTEEKTALARRVMVVLSFVGTVLIIYFAYCLRVEPSLIAIVGIYEGSLAIVVSLGFLLLKPTS